MSDRQWVLDVALSQRSGEHVRMCRDGETRTYRLWIENDLRNVDLTIEELNQLSGAIERALGNHRRWREDD